MSALPIKNSKGESKGEYALPDECLVFDKGQQALQNAVVATRANKRAGTASTKTKAEVAGSGRKPWKQKGTGNARAGYRSSPIWRGGGVAFGPKPRSYNKKVNRKAGRLAFRRAFSEKVVAGQVLVVDDISVPEPKTRQFAEMMKNLGLAKGVLFVLDTVDANLLLASRNLQKVEVTRASDVNAYQLLRYPSIVVSEKGMKALQERLEGKGSK